MNDMIALHYGTIAFTIGVTGFGVGIGEGMVTNAALRAINTQPQAKDDIKRLAIIGSALVETPAIIVSVIAIMLLRSPADSMTLCANWAKLGIAIAASITGFCTGIASAMPAQAACLSLARQPFFAPSLIRITLVCQSLIQTPVIFSFIITLFIRNALPFCTSVATSIQFIASGLSIGLGSIGPIIGLGILTKTICLNIGTNREAYTPLMTFTLISGAIIETSIIFALIIALLILYQPASTDLIAVALLSASLCIGLGTFGAGISSGQTGAAAAHQIAKNPALAPILSRASLLSQGLIDTCAIYALLIAIFLVFIR